VSRAPGSATMSAAAGFAAGLVVVLMLAVGAGAAANSAGAERDGLIAFMRPGTVGEYDVWVVSPMGRGLHRVTKSPAGSADYNPSWSPDGAGILFERRDSLHSVAAAGGTPSRIEGECSGDCWGFAEGRWSPDGSEIAFSRASGPRTADSPAEVAIFVMKADGSDVRAISKSPKGYEDHYPSWSPDGRTILFQRDTFNPTAGPTRLFRVEVESSKERLVYALPRWAPGSGLASFSPDGKRILFGYWCIWGDSCPAATRAMRNSRLATIRPDGTGLRLLPITLRADSAAWSPSGTQIVFRCSKARLTGTFNLCTSRTDGSHLKKFTWPLGSAHPSWGTHP
jgi:Tol biopolymer transport system component